MERRDIAIIGSGPAGISAAINAKIRNKTFYLFGSKNLSEKVEKSHKIDNMIGLPSMNGHELNQLFQKHLEEQHILIEDKRINGIYDMGDYFMIIADQEMFEVSSVILATGVASVKPVKNELELLGRGVSYCATCDGNLYKGKTIAVVCDLEEMEEEVEYLADIVDTLYYIPLFKNPKIQKENVKYVKGMIQEIQGDQVVKGIMVGNTVIPVDGVFFLKASVSLDVLVSGLQMEDGHVVVNRNMETNIAGCFACGDCVGRPYQIVKALGEGNIALHSALSYLAKK